MDQLKQAIAALLPGQELRITITVVEAPRRDIVERLKKILSANGGTRTVRDLSKNHGISKDELWKTITEAPKLFESHSRQPEGGGRPSHEIVLLEN